MAGKSSSGVAASSADIDRHLTSFECQEISRLYQHLITVTKGDSSLAPAKFELAAQSLSTLLKKLSPIRSLSVQAADDTTLHVFSLDPFTSLNELILDRVPPSTVEDIYSFRKRICRLEVINAGIPELRKLLAPIKRKYWAHFKPMHIGVSPSLYHIFPEYRNDPQHPLCSPSMDKNGALKSTGDEDTDAYLRNCWLELTHLRLCNCGIARLDPSLHFLPHLKMLDLSYNDLSHVIHLHDCPDLAMLNLAHNRIRVLSNISLVVGGIQRLNLSYNEISMLDGIENLKHLTKLDLSHNLLDDVREVEHLVGLECLQELFLAGNPLAASRHTAAGTALQEQHYRCEVFGCFMHDCSLQQRPLPLLDGMEITVQEELKIKSALFLPPEAMHEQFFDGGTSSISEDFTHDASTASESGTDTDSRNTSFASPSPAHPRLQQLRSPFLSPAHSHSSSFSSQQYSSLGGHHETAENVPVVLLNKTFEASSKGSGDTASLSASMSVSSANSSYITPATRGRVNLTSPQRLALLEKSHMLSTSRCSTNKAANRKEYFKMIVSERRRQCADQLLVRRRQAEIVDDPLLGQEYDHEFEAQIRRSVRVWDNASPKKKKHGSQNSLNDCDDASESINNINSNNMDALSSLMDATSMGTPPRQLSPKLSGTSTNSPCHSVPIENGFNQKEDWDDKKLNNDSGEGFGQLYDARSTTPTRTTRSNARGLSALNEHDVMAAIGTLGYEDEETATRETRSNSRVSTIPTRTTRSNARGLSAVDEHDVLAAIGTLGDEDEVTATRETRSNARGNSVLKEGDLLSAFRMESDIGNLSSDQSDQVLERNTNNKEKQSYDDNDSRGSEVTIPGTHSSQPVQHDVEIESKRTEVNNVVSLSNSNQIDAAISPKEDEYVSSESTRSLREVEERTVTAHVVRGVESRGALTSRDDEASALLVASRDENNLPSMENSASTDNLDFVGGKKEVEDTANNPPVTTATTSEGTLQDLNNEDIVKVISDIGKVELQEEQGDTQEDQGEMKSNEMEDLQDSFQEQGEQLPRRSSINESAIIVTEMDHVQGHGDVTTSVERNDQHRLEGEEQQETIVVVEEDIVPTDFKHGEREKRTPKNEEIENEGELTKNEVEAEKIQVLTPDIDMAPPINHQSDEKDPSDTEKDYLGLNKIDLINCDENADDCNDSDQFDLESTTTSTTSRNCSPEPIQTTVDSPTINSSFSDKEDISRISDTSSLFTINERASYVPDNAHQQELDHTAPSRLTASSFSSTGSHPSPNKTESQSLDNSVSLLSESEDNSLRITVDENESDFIVSESLPEAQEVVHIASPDVLSNDEKEEVQLIYTGPSEFEQLLVIENLETYFKVQVFGHERPSGASPYMFYSTQNPNTAMITGLSAASFTSCNDHEAGKFIAAASRPERVLGFYYEEVIESGKSDQLLPMIRDSIGGSDETSPDQPMRLIFVLTDIHMYVVRDEFAACATFADAPVPYLHRLHPLESLRSCTLYFGFQRCSLHFHDMDIDLPPTSSPSPAINWRKQGHKDPFSSPTKGTKATGRGVSGSMAAFVYMILTKDKNKTHPIVTTVLPAANRLRVPEDCIDDAIDNATYSAPPLPQARVRPLPKVEIRNKDSQFLDQVALLVHTHDTLRGKSTMVGGSGGKRKARTKNQSIVINPSSDESLFDPEVPQHVEAVDVVHAQLLSQVWRKKPNYSEPRTLVITPKFFLLCSEALEKQDVHLTLLDRVSIKDVHKLLPEDDPLAFTLVLSGSAANSSNKVTRSFVTRKWRLRCSSRSQQTKSVDECRRMCKDMGNSV